MREAFITANIQIRIADLNMVLEPGQEIWLEESVFKGSKDLNHAMLIGAVTLQWRERMRSKKPLPPHAMLSRRGPLPQHVNKPKTTSLVPPSPVEPTVEKPALDMVQLDQTISETVRRVIQSELAKIQIPTPTVSTPAPVLDKEELLSTISAALRQIPVSAGYGGNAASPPKKDDDVLFIPTNIVEKDSKTTIALKTEVSDDKLDDAAQALRNLRKKKK